MSILLVLLGVGFVLLCIGAGLMAEGRRGLLAIPIAAIFVLVALLVQDTYPELAAALILGAAGGCVGALIVNIPG